MNKKTLSLFLALLLFLQVQSNIAPQCGPADPLSCISSAKAAERLRFFLPKKDVLIDMGATANNFLFTDITNLQAVLQSFEDAGNKYDGVRLYFILSDNIPQAGFAINTLYVVLVPTMPTTRLDINNEIISEDDEDHAYIISNQTLTPVNLNTRFVRRWINRFENQVIRRIQVAYQRNYGIQIDETHSIWYASRVMFHYMADGLGPDLLTYLKNHIITQAEIDFASWTLDPSDPSGSVFAFKMSLVFKFTEFNFPVPVYFSFEINDIVNNLEKSDIAPKKRQELITLLRNTYTDTGNPCPTKKCPS